MDQTFIRQFHLARTGHIFTNSKSLCSSTKMTSINSICVKMLMYSMNDLGLLSGFQ